MTDLLRNRSRCLTAKPQSHRQAGRKQGPAPYYNVFRGNHADHQPTCAKRPSSCTQENCVPHSRAARKRGGTRVYTTTPKPNSALRKVARVRLTNGMEALPTSVVRVTTAGTLHRAHSRWSCEGSSRCSLPHRPRNLGYPRGCRPSPGRSKYGTKRQKVGAACLVVAKYQSGRFFRTPFIMTCSYQVHELRDVGQQKASPKNRLRCLRCYQRAHP